MSGSFDFMKLMREAGKIQEKVNARQEELAKKHYTADAGAGMVKATVNGLMELVALELEEGSVNQLGFSSATELIMAAINEAMKRAREGAKGDMMSLFQSMAGGALNGEGSP